MNQGVFIERNIESVSSQDYPTVEHIVVDGGSTDNTLEILRGAKHVIWTSEPDSGQSEAVNKGFRRARGSIVGWLNADDMYEPGALNVVAEAFEADPELGMVYGGFRIVDHRDQTLRTVQAKPFKRSRLINRPYSYIANQTVFLRDSVFNEAGPVDESLHHVMDHDYWIRVSGITKVRHLHHVLAAFRHHDDAKSQRKSECRRERRIIWARHYGGPVALEPVIWSFWEVRSRWHLARMNALRAKASRLDS